MERKELERPCGPSLSFLLLVSFHLSRQTRGRGPGGRAEGQKRPLGLETHITWPNSADLRLLESLFLRTMQGGLRHNFQDLRKHLIYPNLPPSWMHPIPDSPPSRVEASIALGNTKW